MAEAYLKFLYTPEAQAHRGEGVLPTRSSRLRPTRRSPSSRLFTIDDEFGGWDKAQAAHFADGATFDQIYKPGN